MQRVFFTVFLYIAAHAGANADTLAAQHERIRGLMDRRDHTAAAAELRALRDTHPHVFEANNYDYLLGRALESAGDRAGAIASYSAVARRDSELSEYALWRMSQIFHSAGGRIVERMLLDELQAYFPDSILFSAAEMQRSKSLYESADLWGVIHAHGSRSEPLLTKVRDPGELISDEREEMVLLANAHLLVGNLEAAESLFEGLVSGTLDPTRPDDLALAGVRGLDALDLSEVRQTAGVIHIADTEHIRRGWVYQFNRDFAAARRHYLAVVNDHPETTFASEAVFQLGRGFAQELNFPEAIVWFERLLEQYPGDERSKEALLQLASAYSRVGKYKVAVSRYQTFIDSYPDDPRADRAYLNPIDIFRDESVDTDALRRSAIAQERFRGKTAAAQALFAEARIYIAREEWDKALAALERLILHPDLGGSRVPGGTTQVEVLFLRGYVLERLRRYPEAIDVFLSIPDGRNEFYGWRATERLRALANSENSRPAAVERLARLTADTRSRNPEVRRKALQSALRLSANGMTVSQLRESLRSAYAEIPAYSNIPSFEMLRVGRRDPVEARRSVPSARGRAAIADELLFLGLFDEAGPELEAAGGLSGPTGDHTLAVVYTRGDRAYRGAAFIEPLWRDVPADLDVGLIPPEAASLLYPAPFASILLRHSRGRNVDPRFILAVMRQESRFRPDARSVAAARGLMQFIPETAQRMARGVGIESISSEDLYDPDTAVLFAAEYLGQLLRLFPNQHAAAAGSYNGGEENMKRWLNRSRSDLPDRYVPEIAYAQTKDYVQRVMTNYRMYMELYDEELNPKFAIPR